MLTFLNQLCQCPHKCDERLSHDIRERIFSQFYGMGDADKQNKFLRKHMDVRARIAISGGGEDKNRSPRRITCKYLLPLLPSTETVEVCQKAFVSAFVITTKRVRLQREKLISSLGMNNYNRSCKLTSGENQSSDSSHVLSSSDSQEREEEKDVIKSVCLKLDNAAQEIPFKRLIDDPLIPFGLLLPEGITIAPVTISPEHIRDIAIVNNFFSNQLWKPEYIGTHS